jgi:hypothetical protein
MITALANLLIVISEDGEDYQPLPSSGSIVEVLEFQERNSFIVITLWAMAGVHLLT